MKSFEKIKLLCKRKFYNPEFSNVSFLPLASDAHPVFDLHRIYLQNKTALPFPWKTLHVINRAPKCLEGVFPYIAETESLFSVLHKGYTRSSEFTIPDAISKIEYLIKCKKLKRIVFQSPSAFKLASQWFTPIIAEVAREITAVPISLNRRVVSPSRSGLKILVIGSSIERKGLFLLNRLVPAIRLLRPDIKFTCVSSVPVPGLDNIDGLDFLLKKKLTDDEKKRIYEDHDFFLNLSLSDSLGVFLECIQYNLPMIGYPGQHGDYFMGDGRGIIIDSPIYEFQDIRWDTKWSIRNFPKFIENMNRSGYFVEHIDKLIDVISKLSICEKYELMVRSQAKFSEKHLTVNHWLNKVAMLYSELKKSNWEVA